MKFLTILFAAMLVLLACNPKAVEAIDEGGSAEMPKSDIGEGKVVYLQKCGRCHELKTVEDYSADRWGEILPKMALKAKLTDEQYRQVEAYITWEIAN